MVLHFAILILFTQNFFRFQPTIEPSEFFAVGCLLFSRCGFFGRTSRTFLSILFTYKHQIKEQYIYNFVPSTYSKMKTYRFSFHFLSWCVALRTQKSDLDSPNSLLAPTCCHRSYNHSISNNIQPTR